MKIGFALSKVLITLGIIGVVSALTLPAVITNYQKQVTVNKLKKVYTTLSQAVKLSEIDNGEYSSWEKYPDITQTEYSQKYWQPYLKILKVCKNYRDCGYSSNMPFKYRDETLFGSYFPATSYILQDGTYVWIMTTHGGSADKRIIVDLNAGHKPNLMGKDIFIFSRNSNSKIEGADGGTNSCNKNSTYAVGSNCAKKIMENNWKIPDDYPW